MLEKLMKIPGGMWILEKMGIIKRTSIPNDIQKELDILLSNEDTSKLSKEQTERLSQILLKLKI